MAAGGRLLRVATRGGIYDLGRVVGVLALLELTPDVFEARPQSAGLRIDMRIETDPRTWDLCVKRLAALVSVVDLQIGPPVASGAGRSS